MSKPVVLGCDFVNKAKRKSNEVHKNEIEYNKNCIEPKLNETTKTEFDNVCFELMGIETDDCKNSLTINNENLSQSVKDKILDIFHTFYVNCDRPENAETKCEMKLVLNNEKPFNCPPRRLSYREKEIVQKILDEQLEKKIIRPSNSQYVSPIVLVEKKTGDTRMCVDYKVLNKVTQKDNYPLPLIEDLIDRLANKEIFSLLDLKSAFNQVDVHDESVKYTSFITPMGQYEYLKMPFGLKNGPSVFQRFVNSVFGDMIREGKLAIYLDDILIATKSIEEHLIILKEVFQKLVCNKLELKIDKCKIAQSEIQYLGYSISKDGIKPDKKNIESIINFPVPTNAKSVHSFLGLCSYFRKFVEGFSVLAQPLYKLIRKNVKFKFGEEELQCFENLRQKLIDAPVLAIFDPKDYTELHCDASALGYGAILLQRKTDGRMHPIFYFSKRTTEAEAKYHSFELETLAIIYALRRFRIYLHGKHFKIITDCNSLALTLNKKEINPRIARWALELENFDFELEYRPGTKMQHVDALSRISNILVLQENTLEQNLSICQNKDQTICKIKEQLLEKESKFYEMHNGLIYRKTKTGILFYVPQSMEANILRIYHDNMGHRGCEKVIEAIMRTYWFPNMKLKVKDHISNCLKCITFSPKYGKHEGLLHSIPKGDRPFETVHVDHFGPVKLEKAQKKHVLLVIDAFSKFVKLYAVKSTDTKEVISCLKTYFNTYSRPKALISDRGSGFTSKDFEEFLDENNVQHSKIATGSPQANGQVERVNRC